MTDERSAFETTRARLEDIVAQVRRRDVTLEQSLDLLDEAVRLVNECNDLIDQTSFRASTTEAVTPGDAETPVAADEPAARLDEAPAGAEAEGGAEAPPDDARQ